MKWRVEKPRVPGWYWHRRDGWQPEIVHVVRHHIGNGVELIAMNREQYWAVTSSHGEWSGQLLPPPGRRHANVARTENPSGKTPRTMADQAPTSKMFRTADLLTILDGVSEGVVKLDHDARYQAMNQTAADTFKRLGHQPDTMIGKTVWECFPDVRNTIVGQEITRALSTQAHVFFETYYAPDGRWYENESFLTPEGLLLIFRDITSRKSGTPPDATARN